MNRSRLLVAFVLVGLEGCRTESGLADLVNPVESEARSSESTTLHRIARPECDAPAVPSAGHVVFQLSTDHVYRMEAVAGAKVEDISGALDAFGAGKDGFIATSADGESLVVQTSRFGCGDQMCMVLLDRSLCEARVISHGGEVLRPKGPAAVAALGRVIVYPATGGPHARDLFAITKNGDQWDAPRLLSADSRGKYNQQPSISGDGKRILFDCGDDAGSGQGTSICEVGIDGAGLIERVSPKDGLDGKSANHHASYSPDGSVVFEGTWNRGAKQIWRSPSDRGKAPELVNDQTESSRFRFTDDSSPCVLADGRALSVWTGRIPTGTGKSAHELKIMDAKGDGARMVLTGIDVGATGISCSK